jgi:DNA-binding MarR family transcriptional regulator
MVAEDRAPDAGAVAEAVLRGVGLLARKARQVRVEGDLTVAERAALSRLPLTGPATSAELARAERISPQAMGVTLGALEKRGLIERGHDPHDGRRVVFSLTEGGREWLNGSRNARADIAAGVLADWFTGAEIEQLRVATPLLERMAHHLPS